MRITLLVLLWCGLAHAHNPLSARFDLVISKDGAVLSMAFSQAGLTAAMTRKYGTDAVRALSPKAFKLRVLDYLRSKISLTADGMTLRLGASGIRVGDHQTDVKFILARTPDHVNALTVTLRCFEENPHHQSILIVRQGKTRRRAFVSQETAWTAQFALP